jgi:uncharacterized protein YwqG
MQPTFLQPFETEIKEYPLDKRGNPIIWAAQINFSEAPAFEKFPFAGKLKLFISTLN